MEFTANFQRAWMEGGAKTVLTRSFKKAVRPAFKMGSIVFKHCDLSRPMPERRQSNGIVVRVATIDDLDMFADRRLFLERMNSGHRCFVGIEAATGKLTNYRWISTTHGYIPELRRFLTLKAREAYSYDLNTLPEFRRRGIDAYTRHVTYSYLRDTGHTSIYAYIIGDNYPSLNASRTLLRPLGRVWYIQLRDYAPIVIGGSVPGFPKLRTQM